jgi:hypothetical protein
MGSLVFAQSTSRLYSEFLQREQMKLNLQQGRATSFLKSLCISDADECTPYEIRNIVELEVLNPDTQFLLRDRNGDICFGDSVSLVLRCKNEIGTTKFFFTSY